MPVALILQYKPDILLEYSFSRLSKIKKFNNEKFFSLFRKLNYKVYPIGYHKKFYSNNQLKKISLHHDRDNLGVLHLIMEKT